MKLSKIKIAGFKSFVDATEVLMPSNLIGVVGPNGCGKSNIIDAVRWVMGETSAKMLRGESMTDVIFSGSASRKPVGMATVELIFDNSDGQITGEYASYNEISVKRQVNRDSQSFYFLNGSKCRKKDIVDLFLGTGLGPRSYSIIEQGMISKIVESKPEDLRGYIEEAAGVSKYRERRRETERRIARTKENLERLDDLRTEVGKHIQHLQRQAKNAERYTDLKKQFKQIKDQVLALRWQQWHQLAEEKQVLVRQLKTAVEQVKAASTDGEKQIETHRISHQTLVDESAQVQEQLYQINGETGKIEQAIAHSKSLSERHQKDLANTEHSLQQAEQQRTTDQQELQQQQAVLKESTPQLETLSLQLEEAQEMNQHSESSQEAWRLKWDENNHKVAEQNRIVEVEKTRISSLESHMLRQNERLKSVQPHDNETHIAALEEELEALQEQLETQTLKHETHEENLVIYKEQVAVLTDRRQQVRNGINQLQESLHQAKGRRGSLLALQQAAQADDNPELKKWLSDNQHLRSQRLAELIEVDEGWEVAVETVLQGKLQSLVTAHEDLMAVMAGWDFGEVTTVHDHRGGVKAKTGTLAECVKGPDALTVWFNQIRISDDASAAQSLASSLAAGESIITREGDWFGTHWMQVNRGQQQENFLLRKKELAKLNKQITQQETELSTHQELTEQLKDELVRHNQMVEQAQLDVNMSHRKLSELSSLVMNKQQLIEREQQQNQEKTAESVQIRQQLEADEQQIKGSREVLEKAMNELAQGERLKQELLQQQQQQSNQYQQTKAQLKDISDRYYQLKLGLSATQNKVDALVQSIGRSEDNIQLLISRKEDLLKQMSAESDPLSHHQKSLDELVARRITTEKQRDQLRQQVAASQQQLDELERTRHQHQTRIDEARTALESAKLEWQSHELKANAFADQLRDQGHDAAEIMAELELAEHQPIEPLVAQKEEQIERLQRSIVRLEPVNLAAIDEFEEESRRKQYLDEQNDDLVQALQTLEDAIARIDKDTRTLFKETFEAVNSNIKQIFPRLFGGGHAYLELTGNDLLTTGVAIMASPPGKRVSSIQLLSGGEKALTAVSLVFAIFNLNPSPFCMLDEVDAPLDDANVGRFSAMVKEMSEKVQFLFVSHNKVTMEIAHQLMGVTMREAGVSRLVSVDLSEAAQLASE
ncbi:chromosome segregation protein SMC [Marinicella sediminis]|uniref:Chromosome partition protein Smc n=1 Tax=Marinicella sediminis TaxID=1792834 RepID=A0ABV7J7L9_9GAMM|nr:chromosome segregation protein SMC [Marinicella sediminis]